MIKRNKIFIQKFGDIGYLSRAAVLFMHRMTEKEPISSPNP